MYLIVGANGFLGTYIVKTILGHTSDNVIATTRCVTKEEYEYSNSRVRWVEVDVTDFNSVDELRNMLGDISDVKIVYLAAYHHPDEVAENWEKAWNINITALSYFLNAFNGCKMIVYSSTDSVYGEGDKNLYFKESDNRLPVNDYGKQKCIAEDLVLGYSQYVVRFPFLIAPSLVKGRKHFYDNIVEKLNNGCCVEMFEDSYRSSLSFSDAAEYLILLIEKYYDKMPKLLNICSDRPLSKYEIGLMIAQKIGVNSEMVIPISINSQSTIFKTKRASTTVMSNELFRSIVEHGIDFKI